MKRIVILALVLCIVFSGCVKPEISNVRPDSSVAATISEKAQQSIPPSTSPVVAITESPSVTQALQETVPPDAKEVALVYADPLIDMFLTINSPDWIYTKQLYEGEAYFYPKAEDPSASPNGFAISSEKIPKATIDDVWSQEEATLKSGIKDFKWQKEDPVDAGGYKCYRYHFTGSISGLVIYGDYFYWETDKLFYICSLTSEEKKYDTNLALLVDSLKSFKILSEIKSK